ncbi:hypothetical protein SMCF_8771, partial [Streptomyces coelicoflavus ZG0656]
SPGTTYDATDQPRPRAAHFPARRPHDARDRRPRGTHRTRAASRPPDRRQRDRFPGTTYGGADQLLPRAPHFPARRPHGARDRHPRGTRHTRAASRPPDRRQRDRFPGTTYSAADQPRPRAPHFPGRRLHGTRDRHPRGTHRTRAAHHPPDRRQRDSRAGLHRAR